MWRIASWLVVTAVLLIAFWAAFQCQHLHFNHDVERFFPQNDKDLIFYNQFRSQFEPDDNFILIAVNNNGHAIFDTVFLSQLEQLRKTVISIKGIESAIAITNFKEPLKSAFGLIQVSYLNWKDRQVNEQDSLKILQDERLNGTLVSTDGQWLSLILKTKDHIKHNDLNRIDAAIKRLIKENGFEDYHLAGKVHSVSTITKMIEHELFQYTGISILLVLLLLTFIFRRFWSVFTAFVSVVLGLIIFMGLLAWWGRPMDILSALFPILMLIVGMSDVIHLMTKYIDEVKLGEPENKALVTAVKEIGKATLLTSVTTAIGFASLITARLIPVRDFGLTAALGVLVAYAVVITFTVALLYLIPTKKLVGQQLQFKVWEAWLEKLFHLVRKTKLLIGILSVVLLAFCIAGILKIETNTSMLGDISPKSKLRKDFTFFENHFFGVRPFEAALSPQNGKDIHHPDVLNQIELFDNYIRSIDITGYGVSPLTIYQTIHAAYHNNKSAYRVLPKDTNIIKKYHKDINKARGMFTGILISKDEKLGRYSTKIKDLGADDMATFYQAANNWIIQNIDDNILKIQLTGSGRLIDKNHYYIRMALFSGLGIAFILISLIMALLFKNGRMVFISIIPNLFPLLIAGAIMGYFGIELKASTSIIFCLAFGIAVDDTIHFLSKFKIELDKNEGLYKALLQTYKETGKAICLTSAILFFGFISLCLSDFSGTFYVGLMMAITLFSAVIADLVIMPVFIWWLMSEDSQESLKSKAGLPKQ